MSIKIRSIEKLKEIYFPETEDEKFLKFKKTATPEQIGKRMAEDTIKKIKEMIK